MSQLKPEIVLAAIEGCESQKRRIDDQIAELRSMLPVATPAPQRNPRDGIVQAQAETECCRQGGDRGWVEETVGSEKGCYEDKARGEEDCLEKSGGEEGVSGICSISDRAWVHVGRDV